MENQHKHNFACIILAAGKGIRMRSDMPKVMHKLAGKPLIAHALACIRPIKAQKTVVVIRQEMESVKSAVMKEAPETSLAFQNTQEGTGHAVKCGMESLKDFNGTVLVLYGDTPLIRSETLMSLLEQKAEHQATIALLGMEPQNPMGYGRLVMEQMPWVELIVECKDATPEEKQIRWVWGGVMAFDSQFLRNALNELTPSPITNEYYLTALVKMAADKHQRSLMVPMEEEEAMGINDRAQLAQAEHALQQRLRKKAMTEGATLIDPETVYFSVDTKLAQDVVIHPQVVFGPGVTVESGAEIRAFSHLENARVGKNAIIGPFARLRPGAVIGESAHVGNFVEIKNSTLGKEAKANHLTYLGDTTVGRGANIGAGTITCNYDGVSKHQTVIGDYAFIGSNTSLVAPVNIGQAAIVGAGSVITQDVEPDALAVARAAQSNKADKATKIRQRKQKTK
jgi:bifunctional UDP-N-acetylglucosamine pyrophosphorylase / glucosamine-1-phosphate N-acetyltransferase